MYQSINQSYYQNSTAVAPQQNEWLTDYSSILLKESQNFYVPSQASPYKPDNSINSSFNSTYSQYSNSSYYQSSPCQNSYILESFNNQNECVNPKISTPINNEPFQYAMYDTPDDRKVTINKVKYSRKKFLSNTATDILNGWYDTHQKNPYPVQEEKERIAQMAGITVKQVSAWFSNRRNRTQNTKPKRMRRVLEKEINSVFSKIVDDDQTSSQYIIDRLKSAVESSYSMS